jgi:hypothetical protein
MLLLISNLVIVSPAFAQSDKAALFFENPHKQAVAKSSEYCQMLASTDRQQRSRVLLAYRTGKKEAIQVVTEMCLLGMLGDSPACEPKTLRSSLRKSDLVVSRHNLLLLHYRDVLAKKADISEVHHDLRRLQDINLFRGPIGAKSILLYLMVAQASGYSLPKEFAIEMSRAAASVVPEGVLWYVQGLFELSPEVAHRDEVRRYVGNLVARMAGRHRDVMVLRSRLAGSGYLGLQGEQARYYQALYAEVARHMGAASDEVDLDTTGDARYNREEIARDVKRYLETRQPRHQPTLVDFEWSCPWESVLWMQRNSR